LTDITTYIHARVKVWEELSFYNSLTCALRTYHSCCTSLTRWWMRICMKQWHGTGSLSVRSCVRKVQCSLLMLWRLLSGTSTTRSRHCLLSSFLMWVNCRRCI